MIWPKRGSVDSLANLRTDRSPYCGRTSAALLSSKQIRWAINS
jgi:hypothetical protein